MFVIDKSVFFLQPPPRVRSRLSERGSSFERDKIHVCVSGTVGCLLDCDAVAMELSCQGWLGFLVVSYGLLHFWRSPGCSERLLFQNDRGSLCSQHQKTSLLILHRVTTATWRFKVILTQDRRSNPNPEFIGRASAVTPFLSSVASGTFSAG